MNRMAESAPTKDELARAIDDLFYAAQQSALFVYWEVVEGSIVSSLSATGISGAKTLRNGIIESSLLFIRKTTEFFKPRHPQDQPDTIFAYSYLPQWTGVWVIDEGDYTQLHRRVGHITIREARYGKRDWPLVEFMLAAIEQWIGFFSEVSQSPVFEAILRPRNLMALFFRSEKCLADVGLGLLRSNSPRRRNKGRSARSFCVARCVTRARENSRFVIIAD